MNKINDVVTVVMMHNTNFSGYVRGVPSITKRRIYCSDTERRSVVSAKTNIYIVLSLLDPEAVERCRRPRSRGPRRCFWQTIACGNAILLMSFDTSQSDVVDNDT
jgi:hypothetical protein